MFEFVSSSKIYGRKLQSSQLKDAFTSCRMGSSPVVFVSGESGSGKTTLIQHAMQGEGSRKFLTSWGKFEQFSSEKPFDALLQAFDQIVRGFLALPEKERSVWAEQIRRAIGSNGRVVADIIPSLSELCGELPPAIEIPQAEAEKQLMYLLWQFVSVLCRPGIPLVLFIDDMQWADAASLKLIEMLFADMRINHCMLIMAYRSEEVPEEHPLNVLRARLLNSEVAVSFIALKLLTVEDIELLLSDACTADDSAIAAATQNIYMKTRGNSHYLHQLLGQMARGGMLSQKPTGELVYINPPDKAVIAEAARSIFHKTRGNPLYIRQMLAYLARTGAIAKNASGELTFNLPDIKNALMAEDLARIIVDSMRDLPVQTSLAISIAACIGSSASFPLLSRVTGIATEMLESMMQDAIAKGVVYIDDSEKVRRCSFVHDRVQKAAYEMIGHKERASFHLSIARMLVQYKGEKLTDKDLFERYRHLDGALELLDRASEILDYAKMSLEVSRRSRISGAYEMSLRSAEKGISVLGESGWTSRYELQRDLHLAAAEAGYLVQKPEKMQHYVQQISSYAKSELDRVLGNEVLIREAIAGVRLAEAVELARSTLGILGVRLPGKPSKIKILLSFIPVYIRYLLSGRRRLVDDREMTCEHDQAIIRVASRVFAASFISNPDFFPLLILTVMDRSLKAGSAASTPYAMQTFALVLIGMAGRIDSGYNAGKMGMEVQERFPYSNFRAGTVMVHNCFVRHWKEPLEATLPALKEGCSTGLEFGDYELAMYCGHMYCFHSMFRGCELKELNREMGIYSSIMRDIRQHTVLHWNNIFQQFAHDLMQPDGEPYRLSGPLYDMKAMVPVHLRDNDYTPLLDVYMGRLIWQYFFRKYHEALADADTAQNYMAGGISSIWHFLHAAYDALTCIELILSGTVPKNGHTRITKAITLHKKWAAHCPQNHLHRLKLLEAGQARIKRRYALAVERYRDAIVFAEANRYTHELALSYELLAETLTITGATDEARQNFKNAIETYIKWGAQACVRKVECRMSELFGDH